MNQREKLIELLSEFYYQDVPPCSGCKHEMSAENPECEKCIIKHEADYLIDHGVVALPCRCEECENCDIGQDDFVQWCICQVKRIDVDPTDFCSYGKRKGGNER